ncbi:MAG: hypothetical protein ACI4NZ_04710 [Candidatus Enterousia sp.]
MIIVGFTYKTSKILPRIFCRRFRHCAPIIIGADGKMKMYQFIHHGNVAKIPINMRDIRILRAHGWVFICLPDANFNKYMKRQHWTCVSFTCGAIGLPRPHPITPYGLYKKITAKRRYF